MNRIATGLSVLALMLTPLMSGVAAAQDAPVFKTASAEEKARLTPLIAQAAKEGRLAYWDTVMQPETKNALTKAFVAHYGLPSSFAVDFSEIAPSNMITRLEQEFKSGRATVDIAAVASPIWVSEQVKAGNIMKYESPAYAHFKTALDDGFGKKDYFLFNGAYTFVPVWNGETNKFSGTSWNDVLAALQTGRFSVGNGAASDATIMTYIGLRQVLGKPYMEQLAAKKPAFIPKSETIASRVVTGEDTMAFMGMPTRVYQFNQKGASLKFLLPKEGIVVLPQNIFIMNGAPHPAAAKLMFDFILSDEGQNIIVSREAMISGRDGFKSPLPEFAPAIDTLNAIKINWNDMTTEDMQAARKEWMTLFNQ